MNVEHAGDLMFLTYFMVNWKKEPQTQTSQPCSDCGREMRSIVANVGDGHSEYEGLVCHQCKRVVWMRKD